MKKAIIGLAAVLGFSISAMASTVNLPSTWLTYDEYVGGVGHFYSETWNATTGGTLQVTDLYVVGDAVDVYVNSVDVLSTPLVADWSTYGSDSHGAAEHYTTDPNVAWGDPAFSKGQYAGIVAGDQITLQVTQLATTFSDSTVALRLNNTPEPASVFLVGGALGLALLRRRRA